MGSAAQLLVLAAIAVFLILRLRSVLGTRDGFEAPKAPAAQDTQPVLVEPDVTEDSDDEDISDFVEDGSEPAQALALMKQLEPEFSVGEFLQGARSAYEMILMSFERGDIDSIAPFLSGEVYQTFVDVVGLREDHRLTIEAKFVGIRELTLVDAGFDPKNSQAEITVRIVGELISTVRNAAGQIIEGNPNEIKRQKDIWTFARQMGAQDPNWKLIATSD